jgi:hypothetical protein
MKRYGRELEFISKISGDGKAIELNPEVNEYELKELYKLNCLSIGNQTFTAGAMSTYIVKLKNPRII